MALSMPRPIALGNGVYHLNIRVPFDLVGKARGTTVTLPVEGKPSTVRIGDKVIISLRTRDPVEAKTRFAEAEQALARHWSAIRSGPVVLLHKQVVALPGDVYRQWVDMYETDPEMAPERFAQDMRRMDADVEAWRFDPSDGIGEISPQSAEILARLAQPNGPFLLAFTLNRDVALYGVSAKLEDAEDVLFGSEADRVCTARNLIDQITRRVLLREVSKAVRFAAEKYLRNFDGDYGADPNATRFPTYELPKPAKCTESSKTRGLETVAGLFDRWKAYVVDKVAPSTIRRYGPSLNSLDAWAKGRDWRTLTDEDVFAWASYRRDHDNIAAATVNRNDLVAVSSVLSWPTTRKAASSRRSTRLLECVFAKPRRSSRARRRFGSPRLGTSCVWHVP